MSKIFELNRLKITGPIIDKTPTCVILEIAQYKFDIDNSKINDSKYIRDIITSINTTETRKESIKEEDYKSPEKH